MNYFEIPAISNSSLSTFSYDPSYYHKVYVTKELVDKKESASLTFGSLVHCLLLEPEEVQNRYVISALKPEDKPAGMMLEFINALLKHDVVDEIAMEAAYVSSGYKISRDKVFESFKKPENQAYYNEMLATKGKSLITQNEYNLAVQCSEIAKNNPQWDRILGEDRTAWTEYKELEILFNHDAMTSVEGSAFMSTLNLKSKLDHLFVQKVGEVLFVKYFDYKTDSQKPVHKYIETFEYWKTYRQMGFYYMAIEAWIKQVYPEVKPDNVRISLYLVPIDVVRLKSLIYNVDRSYWRKGQIEVQKDLGDLVWHSATSNWEYPKSIYDAQALGGGLTLADPEYYAAKGLTPVGV